MIELHISFHGQTHRVAFGADRAAAQAELDKLVPLLGRDKWGSNGKPEAPTHIVKAPSGDMAVVLEKIESARLIDCAENDNLYRPEWDAHDEEKMDRLIRHRKRLQAEGVLLPHDR